MLFSDRRSSLDVAADILRINGSKTAIMYGGNLSYTQTQKYLKALMEQGFLERIDKGERRQEYRSTEKGQRFLELVDTISDLMGISKSSPTSQDTQSPLAMKPYLIPK